mmetsp:Transcript_26702/g.82130  ORF Transcript_26702/g.82130 Transcript_26702/m.82130 type:complete len:222 (+) Transcript_26702:792-1457(+)
MAAAAAGPLSPLASVLTLDSDHDVESTPDSPPAAGSNAAAAASYLVLTFRTPMSAARPDPRATASDLPPESSAASFWPRATRSFADLSRPLNVSSSSPLELFRCCLLFVGDTPASSRAAYALTSGPSSRRLSRMTTLPSRAAGEKASPAVGTWSASPSCARSVSAMKSWPLALQWFSSVRMTGYDDATNALFLTAATMSENAALLVSVPPCVTQTVDAESS